MSKLIARIRPHRGRTLIAVCVAVVALGMVCLAAGRDPASAQMAPAGQPRQGGPMGPMMMGPMMMPPPAGGVAMVVCKDMIFIASGGKLYKIDPDTMEVVGELTFEEPPQPVGPPPPGAGGVAPGVFQGLNR